MAKSSAYYAALYALCECTKLRNKKFCITFVFVGHRTVMLWRRFQGRLQRRVSDQMSESKVAQICQNFQKSNPILSKICKK